MQEFIDSHSISNELRMIRSSFAGSFLIVEGNTDKKVYQNFIEPKHCQVKCVEFKNDSNKKRVVEIIEILNADNKFTGAIGIVDADFDNLEAKNQNISNLFLTDFHDLECLILISPALEKVLAEFGSEKKINNFGKDIRETLFEIGRFIGYLRWVSLSDELHLTFEGLDFGKFVNKDNVNFTLDSIITTVKNKSQKPDIDNAHISQQINSLASQNHDKKQVACGKDVVEILSVALQKCLGTNNSNNVTPEIIARDLRLAYEFEFFVLTNLYQNIKEWETQNIPFKVFR
jgi:Protein of unknown function (DUF4435)